MQSILYIISRGNSHGTEVLQVLQLVNKNIHEIKTGNGYNCVLILHSKPASAKICCMDRCVVSSQYVCI